MIRNGSKIDYLVYTVIASSVLKLIWDLSRKNQERSQILEENNAKAKLPSIHFWGKKQPRKWRLLGPEGKFIAHIQANKWRWYKEKGLATQVSEDPPTIKLNFMMENYGHPGKSHYLMRSCFSCSAPGESTPLIRHQIIPRCYRRALPKHLIEPLSHDVVPLCSACKTKTEVAYHRKREELESSYTLDVLHIPHPITGEVVTTDERRVFQLAKSAKLLLRTDLLSKIPEDVISKAQEDICSLFCMTSNDLSPTVLEETRSIFRRRLKHGDAMVSHLQHPDEIIEFITSWRIFFASLAPNNLDPAWVTKATQALKDHFASNETKDCNIMNN